MEQYSPVVEAVSQWGAIGAQIHHSLSSLEDLNEAVRALSTRKRLLSGLAEIPEEQLYGLLDLIGRTSQLLVSHAETVNGSVAKLTSAVLSTLQEVQVTEFGGSNNHDLGSNSPR